MGRERGNGRGRSLEVAVHRTQCISRLANLLNLNRSHSTNLRREHEHLRIPAPERNERSSEGLGVVLASVSSASITALTSCR